MPIHMMNQINQQMNQMGQNFQKPASISKTITITLSQVLMDFSVPIEIERWIIENGNKVFEKEVLYVVIPKGIDNGEVITIANKGNVVNDSNKSDVKISIVVENNTDFIREGLDLHYFKKISLKDALCGFSFCLEYINGKTYTLNNNEGSIIVPGYKKLIPHLGLTRENQTGNLIITFEVEFPKEYSSEVIQKLKEIL
jgi:DnaJ family protein A protein 2